MLVCGWLFRENSCMITIKQVKSSSMSRGLTYSFQTLEDPLGKPSLLATSTKKIASSPVKTREHGIW